MSTPDWTAFPAAMLRRVAEAEAYAYFRSLPPVGCARKSEETRPAARARILAEYHAAGRHDARPVADCANCAQLADEPRAFRARYSDEVTR